MDKYRCEVARRKKEQDGDARAVHGASATAGSSFRPPAALP